MNGQHLVELQVHEIKRKFAGVGGKNLNPSEKVAEADKTLAAINRIRHDLRRDVFFSTQAFKNIVRWLESIRTTGGGNGREKS